MLNYGFCVQNAAAMRKQSTDLMGPFPPPFVKNYGLFLHCTAVGFYLLLTIGVLYTCLVVAYESVFADEAERLYNTLYLLYVLFNMMGNFLLGFVTDSSFKGGYVLEDAPKSWNYCDKCKQHCPPRSHHCTICKTCILKRDHHCFFFCRCIGIQNLKFFIPYTLYVFLGSIHCIGVLLQYLSMNYLKLEFSFYCLFSYFLPGALYNWLFSNLEVNLNTLICICVLYGCCTTGLGCGFLCLAECVLVSRGQTPFEFEKGVRPYDKGVRKNLALVFGKYWFVNFLFPVPTTSREVKTSWGHPTYYRNV